MTTEYIFDTSAIHSIGKDYIESVYNKLTLAVSPVTIYELLTHLNDPVRDYVSNEHSFKKNKGHLLICKKMKLLHDPYAEMSNRIGVPQAVHSSRFEDLIILDQVLEALHQTNTLEEFYKSEGVFPDGSKVSFRNLAEQTQTELRKIEDYYLKSVQYYYEPLSKQLKFKDFFRIKPTAFFVTVDSATQKLARHYNTVGKNNPLRAPMLFSALYMYIGYILAQIIRYAKGAGKRNILNIDKNDAEDGTICLHLDLIYDRTLVTNDKKTIKALSFALDALKQCGKSINRDLSISARVIDVQTFKQEASQFI